MQAFSKIVRIGLARPSWTKVGYHTYVHIKFDGVRLSITGVEGPKVSGNARGGCGQIDMHEWSIVKYAPGMSRAKEKQLRQVWRDWHLNDMRAGSPAQEAFLKANSVKDYEKACAALSAAGLNPDASYIHGGKPYAYGSAWLTESAPSDALEFLQSLPDTDRKPAWV